MKGGPAGVLVVGLLAVAGLAGGCGSGDAKGLALQACSHVDRSVTLYERSLTETGPAQSADQDQALAELNDAQGPAAQAAGEDPQWEGLVTTISNSSRVPESDLVGALKAQCQAAESGQQGGGPANDPTGPNHLPPGPGQGSG
jgi:hypothetical protein